MAISGSMSYRITGYKFVKKNQKLLRDNTCQLDYGNMCICTECQTKLSFISLQILASIIIVYRTLH